MNHIEGIYKLSTIKAFALFVILDILCMGMGMGVPIFNILLGFAVGWYLVKRVSLDTSEVRVVLRQLLIYSSVTVCVTFFGMVLVWGWSITMLWKSQAEIVNFGIPLILYEPRASLIGWLVLMIVISPFLQLLTTVFAGYLTLLSVYRKEKTQDITSQGTS